MLFVSARRVQVAVGFAAVFIVLLCVGQFTMLSLRSIEVYTHLNRSYTYEDGDIPEQLDIPPLPLARMYMEDTVHYQVDGPGADEEWDSLFPRGHRGYVVLGPDHRLFGISVFHQLHCLNNIRFAIAARVHNGTPPSSHVTHCLQYLRQMVLCRAETTLEPVDDTVVPETVRSSGVGHTCRDWKTLYDSLD
ncbi:hypothetical protein EXIGLDRAFT_675317 [Exidia glandulosa HHB12029]|uniref:Oxidase ustYa n=1 Tax=Exidia glandulosa HHB12029 TaxID=1314781 RepID=A0A165HQ58_EXIGL|nr:hypothetical protein EXIGLDRAFT_675317 [Exidia glandulosa HHB12029]